MAEYIKRDAVIDAVADVYYDTPTINLTMGKIEAAINSVPDADIVTVVRCRECRYGRPMKDGIVACGRLECMMPGRTAAVLVGYRDTDFCSYGERRE